jgi:hypothetical protein
VFHLGIDKVYNKNTIKLNQNIIKKDFELNQFCNDVKNEFPECSNNNE